MNALRVLLGMALALLLWAAAPMTYRHTTALRPAVAEPASSPLAGRDFVFYVVQPGDTLQSLKYKFRVPESASILLLNPDLPQDKLTPGLRIRIPI